MPVNTLKNVVLPAPLGPMIELMRPSSSSKSTWWSAVKPPKRFDTPRAVRTPATSVIAQPAPGGQEALLAEDHHEHEDEPEDHALVLGGLELGRQVRQIEPEETHAGIAQLVEPEGQALQHLQVQHGDHGGTEHRPGDRAHPAQDHYREHADRFHERERLRID